MKVSELRKSLCGVGDDVEVWFAVTLESAQGVQIGDSLCPDDAYVVVSLPHKKHVCVELTVRVGGGGSEE